MHILPVESSLQRAPNSVKAGKTSSAANVTACLLCYFESLV